MCCKNFISKFAVFLATFAIGVAVVRLSVNSMGENHKRWLSEYGQCAVGAYGSDHPDGGYVQTLQPEKYWYWLQSHRYRSDVLPTIVPARIICEPHPNYTDEAQIDHTEGKVKLRVILFASGEVGNIVVVESLPDGLTEQAIDAASQIKFEPKKIDGNAVDTHVIISYHFALN